jgi:hypothetical protein
MQNIMLNAKREDHILIINQFKALAIHGFVTTISNYPGWLEFFFPISSIVYPRESECN